MEHMSSKANEIDLGTIAQVLWEKRKTLISSILGFIVLGTLLAFAQTTIYKGKLAINPLIEVELIDFENLNQALSGGISVDRFGASTSETLINYSKITSQSLIDKFRAYFKRGKELNSALLQHSEELKNFKGDALELSDSTARLRRNFALEENQLGEISIIITTSNPSESRKILSTAVQAISQAVKRDTLQSINSILAAKEISQRIELERLSVDSEVSERVYEFRKRRSLTLLREQASIARALNTESGIWQ